MIDKNDKLKILIADDSEMNRMILADILDNEFEILEAADGKQAIERIQEYSQEIALVLLDIVMPEMDGFEVLALMNKYHWIDSIPVIMISAENARSYVRRAYDLNVTDYISRPFDVVVVKQRVHNTIIMYAKQRKLAGLVSEQIYEKQKLSSMTVNILSHIVEFRNGESGLHVLHVSSVTEILLEAIKKKTDKYKLNKDMISLISTASAMHDIGKISIPEEILNKPGRLTKEEFEIMKTHSAIGADMLDNLPVYRDEPLVRIAREICRWHHERYDGRGYPDGLKGDEIPISAQVVSVADVYDALTSVRVYKDAYSSEKAIQMILNGECGTFNPLLLECLRENVEVIQKELSLNSQGTRNERMLRDVVDEILSDDDLARIDHTFYQLERERRKNQFFASLAQEIQFEYMMDSHVLVLSDWSAKSLDMDAAIYSPFTNPKVVEVLGEKNIELLRKAYYQATPDKPIFELDVVLRLNGLPRRHHCICKTDWEKSEETGKPELIGAIGKLTDIHDRWEQMGKWQHLATHDMLTGLYNRDFITEHISLALTQTNKNYMMVIFDLDYFKQVNDQHGHLFGDAVLKHVAHQLKHAIKKGDMAARIGGDEFLVFFEYTEHGKAQAEHIFRALGGVYEGVDISVSMGVARTERVGWSFRQLFMCADRALYYSKRAGRGLYTYYDDSMKDMLSVLSPIESDELDDYDDDDENGTNPTPPAKIKRKKELEEKGAG